MILVKFKEVSDFSTRRRLVPLRKAGAEEYKEKQVYGKYQDLIGDIVGVEHL